MATFKIVRNVFRGRNYTIATGLTEEEAREWCRDPNTSSSTATNPVGPVPDGPWFDGYTEEDPGEETIQERAERDEQLLSSCRKVEDLMRRGW